MIYQNPSHDKSESSVTIRRMTGYDRAEPNKAINTSVNTARGRER